MKRILYISLFVILGILFQFFIHAAAEIWYLKLLTLDFEKYGFGFSWCNWVWVHHIASVILLLLGAFLGFCGGKFWWRKLYEEGRVKKIKWLLLIILIIILLILLFVVYYY
jgi:hypothetical protein